MADDDSDRPTLWIELGGQLSRLDDGQEAFAPVFPNSPARPSMFSPSQKFERLPLYSVDETGKLSFQPEDSDWVFSASIRYGRSTSKKSVHQQSYPKSFSTGVFFSGYTHFYSFPAYANKFADTTVNNKESHIILDFQVGKDVGLGMFGNNGGSSVFGFGVRYAQFSSKTNIALKSDPDWHRLYKYLSYPSAGVTHQKWPSAQPYHSNAASLSATRSFHGIGPSISWSASSPFVGNAKDGELTFDWGLNAAVLFGRQKVKTHHQTTERYSTQHPTANVSRPVTFQGPATPDHTRVRTVVVPNVGGFAGLSFHVENFKVSAGYRADFFFGAMDGGIDAAKRENIGFYGPFATVSVGIGG
ncbi:MAG TPA: hypothetical protein VIJ62_11285 [Rhizomicrobium sp.]